MKKYILGNSIILLLVAIAIIFGAYALQNGVFGLRRGESPAPKKLELTPTPLPSPTPKPTPTPIPTPDARIYGPCKNVPVLLYHHVQPQAEAIAKNQTKISVDDTIFEQQMAYLSSLGYTTITPDQLINILNGGGVNKPILLTFDDGYEDFYKYAYPTLTKYRLRATVFLPTGLVNNPDYLTWEQIGEMKSSGFITFGNHTWSHKNFANASLEVIRQEIGVAQTQLAEHGLGPITSFAYPYGLENGKVQQVLHEVGLTTAFTTIPGPYQCAKLPYELRRSRVGNAPLSSYGL